LRWLEEKTPVAEDTVQEVDMAAKEVEPGMSNVPRKASELGACKDLEGHIFTNDSGN
jgi:hypothetical protein